MTTYSIGNPSDPYTFQAPSLRVAAQAIFLLGTGHYAATPLDDHGAEGSREDSVPIFLFGGSEEWVQEKFGVSVDELMQTMDLPVVADALDSVLIGRACDRATYEKGLSLCGDDAAKRLDWYTHWHDDRRSSLNDIGRRARAIAERLRERATKSRATKDEHA